MIDRVLTPRQRLLQYNNTHHQSLMAQSARTSRSIPRRPMSKKCASTPLPLPDLQSLQRLTRYIPHSRQSHLLHPRLQQHPAERSEGHQMPPGHHQRMTSRIGKSRRMSSSPLLLESSRRLRMWRFQTTRLRWTISGSWLMRSRTPFMPSTSTIRITTRSRSRQSFTMFPRTMSCSRLSSLVRLRLMLWPR